MVSLYSTIKMMPGPINIRYICSVVLIWSLQQMKTGVHRQHVSLKLWSSILIKYSFELHVLPAKVVFSMSVLSFTSTTPAQYLLTKDTKRHAFVCTFYKQNTELKSSVSFTTHAFWLLVLMVTHVEGCLVSWILLYIYYSAEELNHRFFATRPQK